MSDGREYLKETGIGFDNEFRRNRLPKHNCDKIQIKLDRLNWVMIQIFITEKKAKILPGGALEL